MPCSSTISNGVITLQYSNGTTVKRPVLKPAGWLSQKPRPGQKRFHRLYELEDWERSLWPWATHRMGTTDYPQDDPLFSSCPVGIKPGTKFQLLLNLQGESDAPDAQWKIESFELDQAAA